MDSITTWLTTHWALVSSIAVVLVAILNAATRHWSGHAGAVKVLLFVVELLSFLTSRDVPGWLKWPFASKSPDDKPKTRIDTRTLMLMCLPLAACSVSWQQATKTTLDSVGEGASVARSIGEPREVAACDDVARKCAADKTPACPALVECQAGHHKFNTILKSIHTGRAAGYVALAEGNRAEAESWAAKVVRLLKDGTALLKAWGVMP
jgi:hypothetical protein